MCVWMYFCNMQVVYYGMLSIAKFQFVWGRATVWMFLRARVCVCVCVCMCLCVCVCVF